MAYFALKFLHVIGAAVLLGTGDGDRVLHADGAFRPAKPLPSQRWRAS